VFDVAGHRGTIGFITAMSKNFCAECNRLRLTAEGGLKTCLFTPPAVSLRDAMRAGAPDAELAAIIRQALDGKGAAHPPLEELAELSTESMIEIGG
jgi:cyclic pyranopterin phosphate synthase